jgi:hypothetical protein
MADLRLPIMAPAGWDEFWALGCWARRDDASPFMGSSNPYEFTCLDPPATDLGLCAHHQAAIFPPEVRTHAPRP